MNTSEYIIARLPKKSTLTPVDIAIALDLPCATKIYNAIEEGKLSAVVCGKKTIRISLAEAERWIRSLDTMFGAE